MATGWSDLTSDEIINIKCWVCAEENRIREGETYCVQCKEYYCTSCVAMHKKFTRGHEILQKTDFTSLGSDGSLPCYPTERCSLHKNEVVSIYCKDHDEVTCATCIALSLAHRSCKNIVSIAEEAENLYQVINVKDVQQKIVQTKKSMQDIKATKQATIQELREALDEEIESVKASRQELKVLLDDMEQKTIQDLQKEFSSIEESLTGEIHIVESLESSLTEVASQLKKAEGNKAQEFVSVKSTEQIISMGQETVKSHLTETTYTISFTPDPSIKAFLKQHKSLGKVSINKLKLKVSMDKPGCEDNSNKPDGKCESTSMNIMQENSTNKTKSKETTNKPEVDASINKAESKDAIQNSEREVFIEKSKNKITMNKQQLDASINKAGSEDAIKNSENKAFLENPENKVTINKHLTGAYINRSESTDNINKPENPKYIPKDGLYTVKKERRIRVRLESDMYYPSIRGCCVTEDGYLLLTDWNNDKLKRADMSKMKVKDYIDLPDGPYTVCTVSKTEAVVTLGNQSIQFVSLLGDKMTATRTLKMNHGCYGVAHIEGKLFISNQIRSVYIYDMNGQQQGKVTTNEWRYKKINHNWHIAVTGSRNKVIVSDVDEGIFVLDCHGNYLSTHKDDNISKYWGLCTDGRNVFLSVQSSGNIIQFGQDFNKLGEIAKFGAWSAPYSMTFDHQNKRLIATYFNNTVTIYELA